MHLLPSRRFCPLLLQSFHRFLVLLSKPLWGKQAQNNYQSFLLSLQEPSLVVLMCVLIDRQNCHVDTLPVHKRELKFLKLLNHPECHPIRILSNIQAKFAWSVLRTNGTPNRYGRYHFTACITAKSSLFVDEYIISVLLNTRDENTRGQSTPLISLESTAQIPTLLSSVSTKN